MEIFAVNTYEAQVQTLNQCALIWELETESAVEQTKNLHNTDTWKVSGIIRD